MYSQRRVGLTYEIDEPRVNLATMDRTRVRSSRSADAVAPTE